MVGAVIEASSAATGARRAAPYTWRRITHDLRAILEKSWAIGGVQRRDFRMARRYPHPDGAHASSLPGFLSTWFMLLTEGATTRVRSPHREDYVGREFVIALESMRLQIHTFKLICHLWGPNPKPPHMHPAPFCKSEKENGPRKMRNA